MEARGFEGWGNWVSGCRSIFQNWGEDSLNSVQYIRQSCAAMNDGGRWEASMCSVRRQCICQFPVVSDLGHKLPDWVNNRRLHQGNIWGTVVSIVMVPFVWLAMFRSMQYCMRNECDDGEGVPSQNADAFHEKRAAQKRRELRVVFATGLVAMIAGFIVVGMGFAIQHIPWGCLVGATWLYGAGFLTMSTADLDLDDFLSSRKPAAYSGGQQPNPEVGGLQPIFVSL